MSVKSAVERLAEREAADAEREAEIAEARAEQKLLDLDAIDALKASLGDSNVAIVDVPFTPGLPVLVAARCPSPAEVKRFQDKLVKRNAEDDMPDPIAAAREVGAACRKYPDDETWAKVLAARPGVLVQLGNEALKLAAGRTRAVGKG